MQSLILFANEYIHVLNTGTGAIHCVQGPCRFDPKPDEELKGSKKTCTVLSEAQYCVIINPWDPQAKSCKMGEREVRIGPRAFPLYYSERLEDGVQDIPLLLPNESLIIEYQEEFEGNPAGFQTEIKGPGKFIPNKYVKIIDLQKPLYIPENEGVYVRDIEKSHVRLVKGPKVVTLGSSEEYWVKKLSPLEEDALGMKSSHRAQPIEIPAGSCLCVLDTLNNKERIVFGPDLYLLQPTEGVKVLSLSAGKPKVPNSIQVAIIRAHITSLDYMSDTFEVRTKDNAKLNVLISYQWSFLVWDEKSAQKVFNIVDFVGYACQSLCSSIREQAALHSFEEFHKSTVAILRKALFKDHTVASPDGGTMTVHGTYFPENGFLVSELDMKEIKPVNDNISQLLSSSIKTTMKLVCDKMEREAKQNADRQEIQSKRQLEDIRQNLVKITNENEALRTLEVAKIDSSRDLILARAKKQVSEMKAKSSLTLEKNHMKNTMDLLSNETSSSRYLEYLRLQKLDPIEKSWILATENSINPFSGQLSQQKS